MNGRSDRYGSQAAAESCACGNIYQAQEAAVIVPSISPISLTTLMNS
jgi:hypothetical protein